MKGKLMKKELVVQVVIAAISIVFGAGLAFGIIKGDDSAIKGDILEIKRDIRDLKSTDSRFSSDIRILYVEDSKIRTEISNSNENYIVLKDTLRELVKSNRNLSNLIARIDERQKGFERFIKKHVK